MPTVEILNAELLADQDFGLDSSEGSSGHHLTLSGWARASGVRVLCDGRVLGMTDTGSERSDGRPGFACSFSVLGLPAECELVVEVDRAQAARVRIRREPLALGAEPGLRPVIVRTLGRSGSTWAMTVLGEHPEIVVYGAFQYEPSVVRWWVDALADITAPVALAQWFDARVKGSDPWWLGRGRQAPPPSMEDDRPQRWLGKDAVEELARLALRMIGSFYAEAAAGQGKQGATCFAEKRAPAWRGTAILRELYPELRELYLVRDFRDVLCSRLSFTRRRGVPAFGLETLGDGQGDADYVRGYMRDEVGRFFEIWRRWQDQSFLLRYEDLVEAPDETLAQAFAYLGVDAAPGTVESLLKKAGGQDPVTKRGHQTAADDRASIGRWRRELAEDLKAACRESFGEALSALGYEA
jgi:hypothetical protein